MTDTTAPAPAAKTRLSRRLKIAVLALALLLAGSLTGLVYFYTQYAHAKNDPQKVTQAEITDIAQKVSRLIALPKGETPILATVNNKDKLRGQPFFSDARDGDKLLIYTKAKKAFIYRPGKNIIVNVGPLVLNAASQVDKDK